MPIAHRLGLVGRPGTFRRMLSLAELDFLNHRNVAVPEGVHPAVDVQGKLLVLHRQIQRKGHLAGPPFPQKSLARLVSQHAILHILRCTAKAQNVLPMERKLHQRPYRQTYRFHGVHLLRRHKSAPQREFFSLTSSMASCRSCGAHAGQGVSFA